MDFVIQRKGKRVVFVTAKANSLREEEINWRQTKCAVYMQPMKWSWQSLYSSQNKGPIATIGQAASFLTLSAKSETKNFKNTNHRPKCRKRMIFLRNGTSATNNARTSIDWKMTTQARARPRMTTTNRRIFSHVVFIQVRNERFTRYTTSGKCAKAESRITLKDRWIHWFRVQPN